jgi:membrane-associated phospholipid phosphatase
MEAQKNPGIAAQPRAKHVAHWWPLVSGFVDLGLTFALGALIGVRDQGGVVQLLKNLFGRARPEDIMTNLDFGSFPSGHVANAAAMAVVLGLLFPGVWVWVAGPARQADSGNADARGCLSPTATGRSSTLTVVMIGLAILFGPIALPIILLIVTLAWGIVGKHAWRPLILASAMVTGVVLAQVIGHSVNRHRPPTDLMLFGPDPSFSFPSGHVLGASDFVLLTAYLVFSRRRSIRGTVAGFGFAVVCIAAAAVSRVYLGYHWATDALASVSLSLVILGCVIAFDTWRTVRVPEERTGV